MQQLLAAGADPLAGMEKKGLTPLHVAAGFNNRREVVPLLLQAGPAAALVWDSASHAPLILAISVRQYGAARYLMEHGLLPPASDVLDALADAEEVFSAKAWLRALCATFVSRQPLTSEEWGRLPTPCTGLGAALPAVLGRSAEEAGLLVRHLPPAEQQRLRTGALCLAHAQRLHDSLLPSPIVGRILAQSAVPL